ncbi:MAG: hypothetical protein JWN04_477 [Myxococcaceae bacterium]|nr:hypothetical protein [Myxococcaceae bacterium]
MAHDARNPTKPVAKRPPREATVLAFKPVAARASKPAAVVPAGGRMCTGSLAHLGPDGQIWVQLEGDASRGAYCLRCTAVLPLSPHDLGAALVLWEAHDALGIVMGRETRPSTDLEAASGAIDAPAGAIEASIDGRRVVLEAAEEIVLRCGEASITLRRNGRIVVKGVHVETSARGTNRIKGGSVKIN